MTHFLSARWHDAYLILGVMETIHYYVICEIQTSRITLTEKTHLERGDDWLSL